jgi:hypothetical protein
VDQIETTPVGSRRHNFVGVKGDLRVELHYADVNDGNGRQACLYIFRQRDPKGGVLVPFSGLWVYRDEADGLRRFLRGRELDTVASAATIERSSRMLAKHLYGFVTRQDETRVLDAIMDYAEDLKNHKPEPGQDKTLDQFLEECDREDMPFFLEVGGVRLI